jgi:hypothetical protein
MKQFEPAVPVAAWAGCPVVLEDRDPVLCVERIVALQSHLTVQATEGAWNAVATTAHKGTFLLRRLKGPSAEICPLRAYEVRHVGAVDV